MRRSLLLDQMRKQARQSRLYSRSYANPELLTLKECVESFLFDSYDFFSGTSLQCFHYLKGVSRLVVQRPDERVRPCWHFSVQEIRENFKRAILLTLIQVRVARYLSIMLLAFLRDRLFLSTSHSFL